MKKNQVPSAPAKYAESEGRDTFGGGGPYGSMPLYHSSVQEGDNSNSTYSRHNLQQQQQQQNSSGGTRSPSPSQAHDLENMLSKKEFELQQVNQLRIKTLEKIIEEKIGVIDQLEGQIQQQQMLIQNRAGTPHMGGEVIADPKESYKKYKQRAIKYKDILRVRDQQLQEARERVDQLQLQVESEKKKALEYEGRIAQLSSKIEKEIKRVKIECQNLLRKQELEFNQERLKLEQRIEEKEDFLRERSGQVHEIRKSINNEKQRELAKVREELSKKLYEKNEEMGQLEMEVQRLISDNQGLELRNEEVIGELEMLKQQSMENYEALEQELARKWEQAQTSEEELRKLQEEFLMFREEKIDKENDYKEQIEMLRQEVQNLKQDRDINVQHVRLVNETEKLNMRSEYEVKVDILSKENCYLKEERKKMMKDFREMAFKFDSEAKERTDEVERLRKELMEVNREERAKDQIIQDNTALKIQNQTMKGQIERVILDNESLKKQVSVLRAALQEGDPMIPQKMLSPHNNMSERKVTTTRQDDLGLPSQQQTADMPMQFSQRSGQSRNNADIFTPTKLKGKNQTEEAAFHQEYFKLKEEVLALKVELFESKQNADEGQAALKKLSLQIEDLELDKRKKKAEINSLEQRLNDAIMKLREAEVREKEWRREKEVLENEVSSRERELDYLQQKVDRLSDPITAKYEKDGLVQTYKKRIEELEEYIKQLEQQIVDAKMSKSQPVSQYLISPKQKTIPQNQTNQYTQQTTDFTFNQLEAQRPTESFNNRDQFSFELQSNHNSTQQYGYGSTSFTNKGLAAGGYGSIMSGGYEPKGNTFGSGLKEKIQTMKLRLNNS